MAAPLRYSRHQQQHRCRAIERPYLRLLVHAEHHCRLGRIEMEPDDAAQLVDKLRVGRGLERLRLVWLEPERPPDYS